MATKYEYYDGSHDQGDAIGITSWLAQSFTPTTAHVITSVKLMMYKVNSPTGTITVEIRSSLTGSALCSGTLSTATLPSGIGSAVLTEITFAAGVLLDASTIYYIVLLSTDNISVAYGACVRDNTSPTYTGGSAFYSDDTGASWQGYSPASDFLFEDWGILSNDSIVTTEAVSSIVQTTATGNGTVVSIGAPYATQHGHVWTIVDEPSRPNLTDDTATKTEKGTPSAGAFTSDLTGLTPNTKYYVRAYITSPNGTNYGDKVDFFTLANTSPTFTTGACTSVTSSSAVGNGNIASAGDYTLEEHGHVWATHPAPTIDDSSYTTISAATGDFTSAITPLLTNTLYYVKAYVKTTTGLYFYGNEVELTTSASLAIVTTQLVTGIGDSTATGNLTLVNNGGSLITQYGVVWKTSSGGQDIATDDHTSEGSTSLMKAYTSAISDLLSNTTYYLKAYATNSTGTAYGTEVSFTTKIVGAPTVITNPLFSMTYTTADARGAILSIGASLVTDHGHTWGTSANPTTNSTANGAGAVGEFSSDITGLTYGTTYYTRAYATNTQGRAYGDNLEFTSGIPDIPGTYIESADALNRVSGIRRTFWAGTGGQSVYQTVLSLGGMSTTYVSPISDRLPPSAVTPEELPAGAGYQQSDYLAWLKQVDIGIVFKLFGHFPTYTEWLVKAKEGLR